MAMLGKRFQRTISMSEIGPASNLHAEKPQAHHHLQPQHRVPEEQQTVDQWDILKNAEAMMMMMMANSGTNTTAISSEEGPLLQERQAQTGLYPRASPASSTPGMQDMHQYMNSPIIPSHHFLDACFYCKRRLRPERDIFIYRGDAAFCTEECRQRQILSDENRAPRTSKKGGAASETAVAA